MLCYVSSATARNCGRIQPNNSCSNVTRLVVRNFARKVKYPINEALDMVREKCERYMRLYPSKHSYESARYGLNIELNLDSRLKTQRMAGVLCMPHNTGARKKVLAMTTDSDLILSAYEVGAIRAGDLVRDLMQNHIAWGSFDSIVATTPEYDDVLLNFERFRRKLIQYNVKPSKSNETLVSEADFVEAVEKQVQGARVAYKTSSSGLVHVPIGPMRMDNEQLIENVAYTAEVLWWNRPLQWGKHPRAKKKNVGKFVIGMSISAWMVPAVHIDLSSIEFLVDKQPVHG